MSSHNHDFPLKISNKIRIHCQKSNFDRFQTMLFCRCKAMILTCHDAISFQKLYYFIESLWRFQIITLKKKPNFGEISLLPSSNNQKSYFCHAFAIFSTKNTFSIQNDNDIWLILPNSCNICPRIDIKIQNDSPMTINGESQYIRIVPRRGSPARNDANIRKYNYILCMYKVDARKIQNLNTTKKQIQNQNAVHTELKSPYQYNILNFKFEYDKKTNLESKCSIPDAK